MKKKVENVKFGFVCALHTAIMWGLVPIAMKFIIDVVDPLTLINFRFVFAFLGLTLYLALQKRIPRLARFKGRQRLIVIAIATAGLLGNFVGFASGVQYLSPTTSQVVAQLGIVVFMSLSVIIFKERLRISQIIGLTVLMIGLFLFFNTNIVELFTDFSSYGIGVWLTIFASVSWSIYAIAQKMLLRVMRSEEILWVIYFLCALLSLPLSSPSVLLNLTGWQWCALLFCGLNTLIAYGTLVLAMEYWRAAEVSAMTTLAPLFSLIFADLFALFLPLYFSMQELNFVGYVGAVVVVLGALFATIGHKIWSPRQGFILDQTKGVKS